MKIARVCPYYYSKKENLDGGLKPYYYNLIRQLSNYGITNDVYTLDSDTKEDVFLLNKRKRFSYLLFGYDAYKKLIKTGRSYDVIHTHQPNSFLLYFFKNRFNCKFVYTLHGSPIAYKKVPIKSINAFKDVLYFYLFNYYISKRADVIITVSSEAGNEVVKHFGVNPDKVFFVPTGADTSVFKPLKMKKDIDFIYVGRFAPKKNIPFLISVFYQMLKKNSKLKLCLIGGDKNDDDYFKIINLVNKLNMSKNVEIHGPMRQDKLVDFYNRSRAFTLLSFEEGMPKTLLEALSCGVPAVVSNNSGMKDVVIHGSNGFFVDINNMADVENRLFEVLNKKIHVDVKNIKDKFSWENIANKIIKIYKY